MKPSDPMNLTLWSTNWDTLYYRLRANFDGLVGAYCKVPAAKERDGRAVYRDGCSVHDVLDKGAEGVRVWYHDVSGLAEKIDADLVIAADGPNSKIR